MRVSDAMTRLRELLRAQDTVFWTERALGDHLNRQHISLCRRMVEIDEGYFNHTFDFEDTDARSSDANMWAYTMPPWAMKVVQVRERMGSGTQTQLGNIIPYTNKNDSSVGWRFDGMNTLRLVGSAAARDLRVTVAKRPALVTKGTLPDQTGVATTALRLDADNSVDALNFPHETLANSYANALIEITGSNARSGQFARVTGSTHFVDFSGTRYTVLTLETAWTTPPVATDTYEMHFELPDQHMDLVLLMAAYRAWGAAGHAAEQKAISGDITSQMRDFEATMRPRQIQGPQRLLTELLPPYATFRTEDTRHKLWD